MLARGLGSKLLVRASHVIETIPKDLQAKVVRLQGNEVELSYHKDQDSIMGLLDALRAAAINIEYVSVLSDSLQDVFVHLTSNT